MKKKKKKALVGIMNYWLETIHKIYTMSLLINDLYYIIYFLVSYTKLTTLFKAEASDNDDVLYRI